MNEKDCLKSHVILDNLILNFEDFTVCRDKIRHTAVLSVGTYCRHYLIGVVDSANNVTYLHYSKSI